MVAVPTDAWLDAARFEASDSLHHALSASRRDVEGLVRVWLAVGLLNAGASGRLETLAEGYRRALSEAIALDLPPPVWVGPGAYGAVCVEWDRGRMLWSERRVEWELFHAGEVIEATPPEAVRVIRGTSA